MNSNKTKKPASVKKQADSVGERIAGNNSMLPWLLFSVGITAVCLSPMLKNSFTNWDDEMYVVHNTLLHGPDWKGIFTQPVSSNYHPLTILSLAFNYQFSALNPFSYYFINLLFHLVNTVLVFIFIRGLSGKRNFVAAFTALLFGIHPMHVESVAWISERKDVLYAFFFLLSLIQYWKFISEEKSKLYWYSFIFFILSLLSKPAAIILPFVLPLLDYWKGRPFNKKLLFEKLPFIVLSILFAAVTLKMQSQIAVAAFEIYPAWMRLFFACYAVMTYLVRFIFPHPLCIFQPFPAPDNLGSAIYFSPIFILGLAVILWYNRKNKWVVFSFLFFIVNLLLILQIVTIGSTIVSERYTYVPYIGLAFLVAMFVEKLTNRYGNQLRWIALTVVSLVLGLVTFGRTKVWKDSGALWTDVILQYPVAPTPRNNRAHYLFRQAQTVTSDAEKNSLYQQVVEDCNVALATTASINLSANQEAVADGNTFLKFDLYSLRGSTYEQLNEFDKAIEDYTQCISLYPKNEFGYVNRGALLFEQNKFLQAIDDFTKAINIKPKGSYYLNRSYCYFKSGDPAKAKEDMLMAQQMGEVIPAEYLDAFR